MFQLFAFRFTFRAADFVSFPPGLAGNTFRGAFGHIFRRIACRPECHDSKTCPERGRCAYARFFEPSCLDGPSGFADPPRPFVIRANSLDGRAYRSGECFFIDVHVFDLDDPSLAYFVMAFRELAREGIGAGHSRVHLIQVCSLDDARRPAAVLYQAEHFLGSASPEPLRLPLDAPPAPEPPAPQSLTLRFLTPTELKDGGVVLQDAPFRVVVARARDRVSALSALYGGAPLAGDFRGLAERADLVRVVRSDLRPVAPLRKSSRTQMVHSIGGLVGEVAYHGAVEEFLPLLRAAYWTGIGRQTVWGKGVIAIKGA